MTGSYCSLLVDAATILLGGNGDSGSSDRLCGTCAYLSQIAAYFASTSLSCRDPLVMLWLNRNVIFATRKKYKTACYETNGEREISPSTMDMG